MAKVDWYAAETYYLNSATITYQNVADTYGCSEPRVAQYASKHNWVQKRITNLQKLQDRLQERTGKSIIEKKAKLLAEAEFVSHKGLQGLAVNFPKSAFVAGNLWEMGANVRTKILGLEDKQNINIQQNNLQQNTALVTLTDIITKIRSRVEDNGQPTQPDNAG